MEVFRIVFVPYDEPPEPLEPGEQTLDLPAILVPSLLGRRERGYGSMRPTIRSCDEGDAFLLEAGTQRSRIVGPIPDEMLRW
jgi:hypothetical protein